MSVQVSLPPCSIVVTPPIKAAPAPKNNNNCVGTRGSSDHLISSPHETMLSDPPRPQTSSGALRRDSLKLSFNRSISEPHSPSLGLNPPCLSPPSVTPSIHPSKRCRMNSQHPIQNLTSPTFLRPPPQRITPAATVSLPNSPCSESSTLQRALLLQKAKTTTPDELASRLAMPRNGSSNHFLIIDCRPFIAYNVNHISGAINVNCCDRFNRKRLQQGKATLADLASTKESKELLKNRSWKEVVVYDDCSDSLEKLPTSHTLFLVMNALVEDHREPVMLLGGLRDFQVSHRVLCEDHLMQPNKPNGLTNASSQLLPDLPSPSELCYTKDIENHPASQVLPYLFLGNMRDASDISILKRLGIKYVLNVTAKPPNYAYDPEIVYKQLEAADNGVQNLRQFFEEAFNFIEQARVNQSGVLIHCHAGVSRSPTIAVAYLMKHYPMAMAEAYKFVKTRRSIISPNLNFMGQLWEFEQGLRMEPTSVDQVHKEPLTVEMQEVMRCCKSEVAKSPALVVGNNQQNQFRWSETTSINVQTKEDDVTSGCSV